MSITFPQVSRIAPSSTTNSLSVSRFPYYY